MKTYIEKLKIKENPNNEIRGQLKSIFIALLEYI